MASATAMTATEENYNCNEDIEVINSFDEMGFTDELLRGINAKGWEKPSPIQARTIMALKNGREIIAQSPSGTGKTGAFSIGALTHVDPTKKDTQVLILSHTRELADQIMNEIRGLSQWMNMKVHSAAGGRKVSDDIAALRSGVQVLVGTPGRIKDLIERGQFRTDTVKLIILDELDNLLQDEFKAQVVSILRLGFTDDTKICMFSATCTSDVLNYAKKLVKDPLILLVNQDKLTLEGIAQYYVNPDYCKSDYDKQTTLLDIYKCMSVATTIIFVNSIKKAEELAHYLQTNDFSVGMIHGKLSQEERTAIMSDFKSSKFKVLVSTDLCARGIDVQNVGLVFNFEMPPKREDYLHRIGRSGRYGRKGVAINLINESEHGKLKDIEMTYSTAINELPGDLASVSATLTVSD